MKNIITDIVSELGKGRSVLLDTSGECRCILDRICEEAARVDAVRFYGIAKGVFHHCEYTSPCNKFGEIKKIILNTNSAKGLRDEFYGILMIDITEWLGHESENYFSILLKFLHDKSAYHKYVFVVNDTSSAKKERMLREILTILRCSVIADKSDGHDIAKELLTEIAHRSDITLEESAKEELAVLCSADSPGAQVAENLLADIVCEVGTRIINADDVRRYFDSPGCIYRNLCTSEKEKKGSTIRE